VIEVADVFRRFGDDLPWSQLQALAKLVRGKLRAALAKAQAGPHQCRTLHGESRGSCIAPPGAKEMRPCSAISARYVFRVAINQHRIVGLDNNGVTIRYKQRKSGKWQNTRLNGHEIHSADSCSTFCPKVCTRSATTASGTRPGAMLCSTSPSHALARPPDAAGSNDVIC